MPVAVKDDPPPIRRDAKSEPEYRPARRRHAKTTASLQLVYKSQTDAHQNAHHPAAVHSSSGQRSTPPKPPPNLFRKPLTLANMQFTGLIASVLAITAAAAPSGFVSKQADNTTMNVTPKQLAFAIEQAECSIGNCLGILSATGCIVSEITARNPAGVIECVSGNKEGLCGCASCIQVLGNFLIDNGICDA